MTAKIRWLGNKGNDLYVLWDHGGGNWSIRLHPDGLSELEERLMKYFHFSAPLPVHPAEMDWKLRDVMQTGVGIEEEGPAAMQEFYEQFVEDFFLKAHPGLSWNEYVKYMGGFPISSQTNLTSRVMSMILDNPTIIGLPSQPDAIHQEVRFANNILEFDTYEAFRDYLKNGIEPEDRSQGRPLIQVDFIFQYSGKSYIIEIKSNTHRSRSTRTDMRNQLLLAGHFINRNFSIDFTLISVECQRPLYKPKLRIRHYTFDEESRELNCIKNSGWRQDYQ